MPVIDLAALSGLFPLEDAHAQFYANPDTDRLHPNNIGHERMAKTLAAQLMSIPVKTYKTQKAGSRNKIFCFLLFV